MHISVKNGKAKVIKGSIVMLSCTRKENNTYIVDGKVNTSDANVVTNNQSGLALLWHQRLRQSINKDYKN